ncbi:MAG: putative secreted protein [Acidimicrobiales bacterium]|nr:putative secreted protein [Acidimicrobiales bacterium]
MGRNPIEAGSAVPGEGTADLGAPVASQPVPSDRGGVRGAAVTVLTGILAAAAVLAAIPAGAAAGEPAPPSSFAKRELKPVDTPGLDPVLDGIDVVETSATRRAGRRLDETAQAQGRATLRWLAADRARLELVSHAAQAGDDVTRDRTTLDRAQATRVAGETELRRRRATERRRQAALAVQQAELRRLAAAIVASGTTDRFAVLGNPGDYSAGSRREAVRARTLGAQSGRVEQERVPWARARGSRLAQQRRVARAVAAQRRAVAALAHAIEVRDEFATLLDQATAESARRLDDLRAAEGDTHDAIVARREARLTATVKGLDLPLVAVDAYWLASAAAPCVVPWWVVAGVGRIESRHGTAQRSKLLADGTTTVHIRGIPLDGRPGTFPVHDTDGGLLDDDVVWDRAVGPMQFLPGTWGRWATDDNHDGKADPHNLYDAAGAAAAYLCFGHGDLTDEAAMRAALLSYNRSVPYGTRVLDAGRRYRDELGLPDEPPEASPATSGN